MVRNFIISTLCLIVLRSLKKAVVGGPVAYMGE
jgi:hypothetical protein